MRFTAALAAALLVTSAAAAPGGADIDKAAMRAAEALNGVLRNCPASFAKIGTGGKKCVGAGGTVEQVRLKLSTALGGDLYSVWRSKDEQRSVYNWVKTAGGYVYLRLQADPDGRAETLVYLDAPPESTPGMGNVTGTPSPAAPTTPSTQIGNVTLTPAPAASNTGKGNSVAPATPTTSATVTGTPTTATPAPQSAPQLPVPSIEIPPVPTPASVGSTPMSTATPPSTPTPEPTAPPTTSAGMTTTSATVRSLAPVPFGRVLQLQTGRMNGPDVRAVQNRLIALMRPARSGQGDGWYGPVTTAAVRAFQAANSLPATGQVDRATWDALFSPDARTYTPPKTP